MMRVVWRRGKGAHTTTAGTVQRRRWDPIRRRLGLECDKIVSASADPPPFRTPPIPAPIPGLSRFDSGDVLNAGLLLRFWFIAALRRLVRKNRHCLSGFRSRANTEAFNLH